MKEYIVDFGDKSSAFVGLAMAEVRAHGAELCEPIVRCKDCYESEKDEDGDLWCPYLKRYASPSDFCAWGWKDDGFVTCKCGEEIEAFGRVQTCPSCGRRLMA